MSHPSAPVDALLLDIGNVVIEIDFQRVLDTWARHSGGDAGRLRQRFGFDEAYQRHERGEIDVATYFDSLRRTLDLDLDDARLLEGWNAVFVREMDGVGPLLERAATHLPVYGFSNTNAAHHAYWATRFDGVLAPFREVFVSSRLGHRKPEPAAFHAVLESIGLPAERVLFLDDTHENVEGARAVGLQAEWVRGVEDVHRIVERVVGRPAT